MNKISFFFIALAFLGGAMTPSVDIALANKAGGAKTRLPHSLKQDNKPQDEKQPVEKLV